MVELTGSRLSITTSTLKAVFDNGKLVSLTHRSGGGELVSPPATDSPSPLILVFANGQQIDISSGSDTQIIARRLDDRTAEYRFHSWSGDGILRISECPDTGDLLVEPSAYSSRMGLVACRWSISSIAPDLRLVAPFFQGINLEMTDTLTRDTNWNWPHMWEAGFAILQGKSHGFSVHVRDTQYRPKSLKVGTKAAANCLGFNTEAFGPVDQNRGAGGLVWHINVHGADWREPARRYRAWLFEAYDLAKRMASRPAWLNEIRLAASWVRSDPAVLDALAEKIAPSKVLLHLSEWRDHGYDEYYPDFTPSSAARAFMAKARGMGFHVAPHCNSIDMDPSHPVFALLRDFVYTNLDKTTAGWAWRNNVLPVPGSNKALVENRSAKVMVKIHPGLSMWRSILRQHIEEAMRGLNSDSVFIDVTSCTWNLHNALVENMTCTQGMAKLIDDIGAIPPGMAVGGEGLNEITMQGLCFAQAHLFLSWQTSIEGLARTAGTAVNAFLFADMARTFGYSDLSGKTENSALRMRTHHSLGAIPTFTGLSAEDIRKPNKAVQELFELACS